MFMMADPEVHFHILPRYASDRKFENKVFKDVGWPNPPDTKAVNEISEEIFEKLVAKLKEKFAN